MVDVDRSETTMATCPRCHTPGRFTVRRTLVAKPLGTFSLAGAQMKVSAVATYIAECGDCGFTVTGRVDGGHFVSDAPAPAPADDPQAQP